MSTRNMMANIRKTAAPFACGMLLWASSAWAQSGNGTIGDVIGFKTASSNQTFMAAGDEIEFTIRLSGPWKLIPDPLIVNPLLLIKPVIRMRVGTSSSAAWATIWNWDTSTHTSICPRTDLMCKYVVRPGDMAQPLTLYWDASGTNGFTVIGGDYTFVNPNTPGVPVDWRVNQYAWGQPSPPLSGDNAFTQHDLDLTCFNMSIRTLWFDAGTCPTSLLGSQTAMACIKMGATTTNAIDLTIWTPDTTVLQIGGMPAGTAYNAQIVAGTNAVYFPVKGIGSGTARVYAQRGTDYNNPVGSTANTVMWPTVPPSTYQVNVSAPLNPTVSIVFPNDMNEITVAETNAATGRFRIQLSEASTNDVLVAIAVGNFSPETNITLSAGTVYRVPANQTLSPEYSFTPSDGTVLSENTGVLLTPAVTNTSKYADVVPGRVYVQNVLPVLRPGALPSATAGNPCNIPWSVTDVPTDRAGGIFSEWDFGDGSPHVTATNTTASGGMVHSWMNGGTNVVTVMVWDKDSGGPDLGEYTTTQFQIVVTPAPPTPSVRVSMTQDRWPEGSNNVPVTVSLSDENNTADTIIVTLAATMTIGGVDVNQLGSTVSLGYTTVSFPPGTQTRTTTISFLDGTVDTAGLGIKIAPTVTAPAGCPFSRMIPCWVYVDNKAPAFLNPPALPTDGPPWTPYSAIPAGEPFTFEAEIKDVPADVNGTPNIAFSWKIGSLPWTSVPGSGDTSLYTHTFTTPGRYIIQIRATDKDDVLGTGTTTIAFPVIVVPAPDKPCAQVISPPPVPELNSLGQARGTFTVTLTDHPFALSTVRVFLSVTPPVGANPGGITVPAYVDFPSMSVSQSVTFTIVDGTQLSAMSGFTVTPSFAAGSAALAHYTGGGVPGNIQVENVAPRITAPQAGSTGTVVTAGVPYSFFWSVLDIAADLPGMVNVWNFGDGSAQQTTYGGSGNVQHTYATVQDGVTVTLTSTDKDGDSHTIQFYLTVRDSKKVVAIPVGPNSGIGIPGMPTSGRGWGEIISPSALNPAPDAAADFVYTFVFPALATTASFTARPGWKGVPGPDGHKSFFFIWSGPVEAFSVPEAATMPLYSGTTNGTATIKLTAAGGGAGGGGGQVDVVEIRALFSREFKKTEGLWIGDNLGDINQDGIPDTYVLQHFANREAAAGGGGGGAGGAINPIWFQNLSLFNEDGDYAPVNPNGTGGVWDFRPIPGDSGEPFTALRECRGKDDHLGSQMVQLGDGTFVLQDDDPHTDPHEWDTDGDTLSDGWEYWFWYESYKNKRGGWRYNPRNIGQGDPIQPWEIVGAFNPSQSRKTNASGIDQKWWDDFDNDGLLDFEEQILGTDPTNWDTDGDGMADGWEVMMGLNPCDPSDGLNPARNNPDGDYFAIATVPRVLVTIVTSNDVMGIEGVLVPQIVTNYWMARNDGGLPQARTFTTCYRYGNNTAPWAVGRPITTDDPDWEAGDVIAHSFEVIDALILHFQVRNELGYDPRTAWTAAVTMGPGTQARFEGRYLGGGTSVPNLGRWGGTSAPNTRPFTSVDEYLLMKFMSELRMNDAGAEMPSNGGDAWFRYSTHPRTPDTGATPERAAGVPDGWKLYNAVAPGVASDALFTYSPWNNQDGILDMDENNRFPLQREFWATDTLPFYANPAQYTAVVPYINGEIGPDAAGSWPVETAVIQFRTGLTNSVQALNRGKYTASMQGVVTIARPAGHADNNWINKFWPTDPWNSDTDGDGVSDSGERTFVYGVPVDDQSVCIPGGGLNPCSVDTDRDGIPDAWEVCFSGTIPALGAAAPNGPLGYAIENGMDGTVDDANEDWDNDGLVNFEEYMTQSIRGFRYDIPAPGYTDTTYAPGQRGLPMDISFNIADVFTQVTNTWDQARMEFPPPGGILWFMRPLSGVRYASTDPSNPDTDLDGMDDYYELYHGLNPLLGHGNALAEDRVAWAYPSTPIWWNVNWWVDQDPTYLAAYDFVSYPWLNGMPLVDPDADGLLNLEEMLLANGAAPECYNTDPTPIWVTDPSNQESITARFFRTRGASTAMYFWNLPLVPTFMFDFEMNEGYDSDNDGISDKDELIGNRNAKSDPRDSESPFRRQAMWFSGTNSAAGTPVMYNDRSSVIGWGVQDMEHAFKSFTVELWVRPERADRDQVLIERVFDYGTSDFLSPLIRNRRNFVVGIDRFGRAYAGFDNAGGHDEHTDSARLYGQQVPVNKWTHLAARMDGRAGKFTLFVNGIAQDTLDTELVPANGILTIREYPVMPGSTNLVTTTQITSTTGMLVLGAENNYMAPLGFANGGVLGIVMSWASMWEDYDKFYQGWMDEVRVWDGARTNFEINRDYKRRLTYEEMMANRAQVQGEFAIGGTRDAWDPAPVSPLLMNYYTFNSLFSALREQDVAVTPRGFNTPAAALNRPADANVKWWEETEVTSTVYTDKQYVPWIQNVAAHLPLYGAIPPNAGAAYTLTIDNVVADSYYWRTDWTGTQPMPNSFPNRNNPYGFAIDRISTAQPTINRSADLVPMGDAWAKQCVDLWDGQGPTGTWLENAGTTDDGLPQWWIDLHHTSAGWNDIYSGTNAFYLGAGMANSEVYHRELAKGLQPNLPFGPVFNPAYAQKADSDGDGMPDWWEKLYGLNPLDATGDNGAYGDPDLDGLSNISEYLISEVYGFHLCSPRKFKTIASQAFSDYYVMQGRVPLGFMFSDHDFIEDWWEALMMTAPNAGPYAPSYYANWWVYDPYVDYDFDGWSNWAEARYSQAIRSSRPDLQRRVIASNGTMNDEFPIPVVKLNLVYKGRQDLGPVTVHAFSDPSLNGPPDAVWSLTPGGGVTPGVLPLGPFEPQQVKTHLNPGHIVPGSINFRVTSMANSTLTATTSYDRPRSDDESKGIIYGTWRVGWDEPIGTIDYVTGEVTFDLSNNVGAYFALANGNLTWDDSYVELLYAYRIPDVMPLRVYLGVANTGYLREGTNYFLAFMSGGGGQGGGQGGTASWTPGAPMGVATPFGTDIGWDQNSVNIQLTDYTPGYLRMSLDGTRTEDVIFGTGGQGGIGGGGQQGGVQAAHVRVRRAMNDASPANQDTILDKMIFGRDYIHEGDFMTAGHLAMDWGTGLVAFYTATYEVYLGDTVLLTNSTLIASFTNSFPSVPAKAVAVSPMSGAYVYSARPTFVWSMPEDYNAFAFEFRKGSSSGTLLYPIQARQAPVRDPITGNYVWQAPFYIGDKDVVNNGLYYWRVAPLNAKYTSATGVSWSDWRPFRWDVNQPMQSSGYGQINATVKYLGPAANLAGKVILEAFDNRGFTGDPAARFVFMGGTTQLALVTDPTSTATNAFLRGLAQDTYYLRAFIDSNGNGVHDIWESWGYANYYGEQKSMYNVRPVEVKFSAVVPAVSIFIEDCDVDQDWFPDAWEYEQNPGSYPTFLGRIGPDNGWTHGNAEINPDLTTSSSWSGIPWLMSAFTSGSVETQTDYIGLLLGWSLSGDGFSREEKVEMGLMPSDILSLRITKSPDPSAATVTWQMSVVKDMAKNTTEIRGAVFGLAEPEFNYEILYSDDLEKPLDNWESVATGDFNLSGGMYPTLPTPVTKSALNPERGFFRVRVKGKK